MTRYCSQRFHIKCFILCLDRSSKSRPPLWCLDDIYLDTSHSAGLHWKSDQPVTETSTWQHKTLTRETSRWDLNPKPQQVSGHRPRTETMLPLRSANMKRSASKFVFHLLNDYHKQNQLSLCKDLQVPNKEAKNFLYSHFWPAVLIDKSPMKWMKIWGHGRDSSWNTGGAGQHCETGGPEIISGVVDALSPVYPL
jgi:hypothetical protein